MFQSIVTCSGSVTFIVFNLLLHCCNVNLVQADPLNRVKRIVGGHRPENIGTENKVSFGNCQKNKCNYLQTVNLSIYRILWIYSIHPESWQWRGETHLRWIAFRKWMDSNGRALFCGQKLVKLTVIDCNNYTTGLVLKKYLISQEKLLCPVRHGWFIHSSPRDII